LGNMADGAAVAGVGELDAGRFYATEGREVRVIAP
jgi:hypothetical protein